MERITGLFIIVFTIFINLTGFLAVAFIAYPNDTTMVSCSLEVFGSIIYSALTLFGVKWTLDKQAKEKYCWIP